MKLKTALSSAVVLGLMSGSVAIADHHEESPAPKKEKAACKGKDGCGGTDKTADHKEDKASDKKAPHEKKTH